MTDRAGMTFLETLACLLVLAIGFLAAIALARYGQRMSEESIAASLALPTARSILLDTRLAGPATRDLSTAGAVTTGYVNGLFVRRTVLDSSVVGDQTFADIRVEVFWSGEGERALTVQERMVFHAP